MPYQIEEVNGEYFGSSDDTIQCSEFLELCRAENFRDDLVENASIPVNGLVAKNVAEATELLESTLYAVVAGIIDRDDLSGICDMDPGRIPLSCDGFDPTSRP
jgi:hypothetical protein